MRFPVKKQREERRFLAVSILISISCIALVWLTL